MQSCLLIGAGSPLGQAVVAAADARGVTLWVLEELGGDPEAAGLGLSDAHRAQVTQAGVVLNCSPVPAVAPLLEWLQESPELRLVMRSTTGVSGDRAGLMTEADLELRQSHRDPVGRACFEAELAVRSSPARSQVTVARVAPLLGGPQGSPLSELDRLGQVLSSGRRAVVAADQHLRVEAVQVQSAADELLQLALNPRAAGQTVQLVAGWQRAPALAEFAAGVCTAGSPRLLRLPPMLAPLAVLLSWFSGGVFPRSFPLARYFRVNVVFDRYNADRLLGPPAGQEVS